MRKYGIGDHTNKHCDDNDDERQEVRVSGMVGGRSFGIECSSPYSCTIMLSVVEFSIRVRNVYLYNASNNTQ